MNKKGFTLIELIVAMAVFVIAISVVLSLFMMGLRAQRKAIALQDVQDNARFLLGFIAKELRMSEINSVSSNTLNITRSDGREVEYVFVDGDLERSLPSDPSSSGVINSDQVNIEGFFYGIGVGGGDGQQPRITIVLNISSTGGRIEEQAQIEIQTTLSPRNLQL
ncbi:MAG: prepilin-type N-terminal cleavage/methylation domain-containing protein [Candidatus Portnoybacteria bacterium]|nr:prepilin-type N-terminal cleavage/methylation domain-containing protein [Candidatus Portnoybacteria bacterium]